MPAGASAHLSAVLHDMVSLGKGERVGTYLADLYGRPRWLRVCLG